MRVNVLNNLFTELLLRNIPYRELHNASLVHTFSSHYFLWPIYQLKSDIFFSVMTFKWTFPYGTGKKSSKKPAEIPFSKCTSINIRSIKTEIIYWFLIKLVQKGIARNRNLFPNWLDFCIVQNEIQSSQKF